MLGGFLGRSVGRELVGGAEEVFAQAVLRGPEIIQGFRIFGNKGIVGNTFSRNIFLIEAQSKGAVPLRTLINSLEQEALAAGATRLSIVGHAVINRGFLSAAVAQRFGFAFRQINDWTVELTKVLKP